MSGKFWCTCNATVYQFCYSNSNQSIDVTSNNNRFLCKTKNNNQDDHKRENMHINSTRTTPADIAMGIDVNFNRKLLHRILTPGKSRSIDTSNLASAYTFQWNRACFNYVMLGWLLCLLHFDRAPLSIYNNIHRGRRVS